ncbi:MAG: zf-HC2 domain-containing protein [Haloechinothrix sp.]
MTRLSAISGEEHVTDLLPAYINGTLDVTMAKRIRSHLEHCPACRVERDAWASVASATRAWAASAEEPVPGSTVIEAVWAAIEQAGRLSSVKPLDSTTLRSVESSTVGTEQERRGGSMETTATSLSNTLMVSFNRPREDQDRLGRSSAWWSGSKLATVAVLLLAFAAGYVAYLLAPDSSIEQPSLPSAAQEAANATPVVPDSSECRIEPRTAADIEGRLGVPAAGTPVVLAQPPYDLPEGEPADAGTTEAITATWREFWACVAAQDPQRAAALFSDAGLGRIGDPPLAGFLGLPSAPRDYPYQVHSYPYHLIKARVLEDRRVAATFDPNPPLDPAVVGNYAVQYGVIFIEVDGRWLIDELGRANG